MKKELDLRMRDAIICALEVAKRHLDDINKLHAYVEGFSADELEKIKQRLRTAPIARYSAYRL